MVRPVSLAQIARVRIASPERVAGPAFIEATRFKTNKSVMESMGTLQDVLHVFFTLFFQTGI